MEFGSATVCLKCPSYYVMYGYIKTDRQNPRGSVLKCVHRKVYTSFPHIWSELSIVCYNINVMNCRRDIVTTKWQYDVYNPLSVYYLLRPSAPLVLLSDFMFFIVSPRRAWGWAPQPQNSSGKTIWTWKIVDIIILKWPIVNSVAGCSRYSTYFKYIYIHSQN